MAISSWDPAFETGNILIDSQHRAVIGLLDELREAEGEPEQTVLGALGKVIDFTVFHFIAEEELMRTVGYPEVPTSAMLAQHREFTSYSRLRVLEFRGSMQLSVLPLADYLEQFLEYHEFGMDRLLADWIREQPTDSGTGAAAV